ncbi:MULTISPECIES: hypothetical protein [unclassified Clostridium]|uniref:hypothetical protein n=1 Tax=unclassified Clostridium TaxID=2614128 RepID=UPI00052D9D9C|nr:MULTISPECIES: hypothetical protein [unclassified Clostridium]KGK88976.1 hypothetical protein DP68_05085 [Clostridium sp. HMP27]MBE6068979.1 hypothetical protein [Clostridium lundense]
MSDFRLDIRDRIILEDYSVLYDYMDIPSENDRLTINIKNNESEDIDLLCKILLDKGFDIINENRDDDWNCNIIANRRNKLH